MLLLNEKLKVSSKKSLIGEWLKTIGLISINRKKRREGNWFASLRDWCQKSLVVFCTFRSATLLEYQSRGVSVANLITYHRLFKVAKHFPLPFFRFKFLWSLLSKLRAETYLKDKNVSNFENGTLSFFRLD